MRRREPVEEPPALPAHLEWENRPADADGPEVQTAWNAERLRWYDEHGIDYLDVLRAQSQPRSTA